VTGRFDGQQQRIAERVQRDHPDWVIMWGCHSRLYWAFPRFNAPQGTVIAAPDPAELTEHMRQAELAAVLTSRTGRVRLRPPWRPEPARFGREPARFGPEAARFGPEAARFGYEPAPLWPEPAAAKGGVG
jgi:hypothetical protein